MGWRDLLGGLSWCQRPRWRVERKGEVDWMWSILSKYYEGLWQTSVSSWKRRKATSCVTKAKQQALGICNLTHPPSSPDLNPTEPLQPAIKNCVINIPGSSNSLNALWAAVQKVWDGVMEEEIKKYTGRMADRVLAWKKQKDGIPISELSQIHVLHMFCYYLPWRHDQQALCIWMCCFLTCNCVKPCDFLIAFPYFTQLQVHQAVPLLPNEQSAVDNPTGIFWKIVNFAWMASGRGPPKWYIKGSTYYWGSLKFTINQKRIFRLSQRANFPKSWTPGRNVRTVLRSIHHIRNKILWQLYGCARIGKGNCFPL